MVNSPITSLGAAACASAVVNSGSCVVTVTGTVRAAPVAMAAVFTVSTKASGSSTSPVTAGTTTGDPVVKL